MCGGGGAGWRRRRRMRRRKEEGEKVGEGGEGEGPREKVQVTQDAATQGRKMLASVEDCTSG